MPLMHRQGTRLFSAAPPYLLLPCPHTHTQIGLVNAASTPPLPTSTPHTFRWVWTPSQAGPACCRCPSW